MAISPVVVLALSCFLLGIRTGSAVNFLERENPVSKQEEKQVVQLVKPELKLVVQGVEITSSTAIIDTGSTHRSLLTMAATTAIDESSISTTKSVVESNAIKNMHSEIVQDSLKSNSNDVEATTAAENRAQGAKLNKSDLYLREKEIINKMMASYEKNVRPYPANGGPTVVGVNVFVRSISSINENSMDYSVDIVVREFWNDDRLEYNASGLLQDEIKYLKTGPNFVEKIWVPDLFFPTERRGESHSITVPNRMLRIFPNGDIMNTARYTLTLACDMNLVKYPFDVQRCPVQMGSYSFTTETLVFDWEKTNSITVNQDLKLPKFKLENWGFLPCSNYHKASGNFSCIKFEFVFSRQIGFHIIEAYLPTSLLVIASWMGFWIDPSSVPGRVALSVTTMLTTVAQSTNVKHSLPPVSYIKAIDIWLGVCIFFVFSALAEFALVNYLSRAEDRRKSCIRKACNAANVILVGKKKTRCSSFGECMGRVQFRGRKHVLDHHDNNSAVVIALPDLEGSPPSDWGAPGGQGIKAHGFHEGHQGCCAPLPLLFGKRLSSRFVDKMARILFPLFFITFMVVYMYTFAIDHSSSKTNNIRSSVDR